jgi:hypothetical protein
MGKNRGMLVRVQEALSVDYDLPLYNYDLQALWTVVDYYLYSLFSIYIPDFPSDIWTSW